MSVGLAQSITELVCILTVSVTKVQNDCHTALRFPAASKMTAKTEMPEKSPNARILQDGDNYSAYLCVPQMPSHSRKATYLTLGITEGQLGNQILKCLWMSLRKR